MYTPRIYINKKININEKIKLKKKEMHYCINVIRLQINDSIHLFNNTNYIFIAKIIKMEKNNFFIKIIEKKKDNRESQINIHLGQMISKKMNTTIEKSVELGVYSITPIIQKKKNKTKYSKEIIKKKFLHWNKIIISACSQSQRNILPILNSAKTLKKWLTELPPKCIGLIFNPDAKKNIYHIPKKYKNIYILIGSEKGFTQKEIKLAKEKNFLNISLGPRILKTETASIVAITAVETYLGSIN